MPHRDDIFLEARDRCLLAQTAAEARSLAEPIRVEVSRLIDDQIQQMHRLLAASRAPNTSNDDLLSLATYIVSVAQAVAVMHRAGIAPERLREVARHAVRALDLPNP